MQKISIMKRPVAPNVCNQELREVYGNKSLSVAHNIVEPGGSSLLHSHKKFTELYYIIAGQGIMCNGEKRILIKKDDLIELKPGELHKLTNTGKKDLIHLVISTPPFDPNDVHIKEEI